MSTCAGFKNLLQASQIAMSNSEYGLNFSARDLPMRLVRDDRSIRGKITTLCEPLWLHRGGYPEPAVLLADVHELLQHGIIEFSSKVASGWRGVVQGLEGGNKGGWSGSSCVRQTVSTYLLGL